MTCRCGTANCLCTSNCRCNPVYCRCCLCRHLRACGQGHPIEHYASFTRMMGRASATRPGVRNEAQIRGSEASEDDLLMFKMEDINPQMESRSRSSKSITKVSSAVGDGKKTKYKLENPDYLSKTFRGSRKPKTSSGSSSSVPPAKPDLTATRNLPIVTSPKSITKPPSRTSNKSKTTSDSSSGVAPGESDLTATRNLSIETCPKSITKPPSRASNKPKTTSDISSGVAHGESDLTATRNLSIETCPKFIRTPPLKARDKSPKEIKTSISFQPPLAEQMQKFINNLNLQDDLACNSVAKSNESDSSIEVIEDTGNALQTSRCVIGDPSGAWVNIRPSSCDDASAPSRISRFVSFCSKSLIAAFQNINFSNSQYLPASLAPQSTDSRTTDISSSPNIDESSRAEQHIFTAKYQDLVDQSSEKNKKSKRPCKESGTPEQLAKNSSSSSENLSVYSYCSKRFAAGSGTSKEN